MSNTETSLANTLNQSYPIFEPNQLLTSTHLNQLRNYLDNQDRLSRVKLVGIGIVCGLEVSFSDDKVKIAGGTGITSDGFLICMNDEEFIHVGEPSYLVPNNNYPPFKKEGEVNDQIQMWELLADDTEVTPLINFSEPAFTNFLDDKVVVLFVEYKDMDLENCVGENCDDKGINRQFKIRKLLLHCDDVDTIIRNGYGIEDPATTLDEVLNMRFLPDYAQMPAFSLIPEGTAPGNFPATYDSYNSSASIHNRYADLFPENSANPFYNVAPKIVAAYEYYLPWLEGEVVAGDISDLITTFIDQFNTFYLNEQLQYYYDYAKDIVLAYNEFIDIAFEITAECSSTKSFPRHLLLGKVKAGAGCPEVEDDCKPALYRTHFVQSPIYNQQKDKLAKAKLYFKRLVEMITNLQAEFSVDHPIKITPSHEKQTSLGDRSIPFYYEIDPLYKSWSYELRKRCKSHWNLGYWSDQLTPVIPSVHEPLKYNKDPYNFYRIEGIIGRDYREVCEKLDELKHAHHLDFKTISLKLRKNTIEEIQSILAEEERKCWRNIGCCHDHIKEDYLQLRNEIIAEVEKYNWILTKMIYILSNFEEVLPSMMEGNVLENAPGASSGNGLAATEVVDIVMNDLLPSIDQVQQLIDALPKCIDDFNFEAFKTAFKEVQEMAFITAVLFERIVRVHVLLGPFMQYMIERFLLVNYGYIGSIYDLNDILRSNLDVQMSSIYFSYLQRVDAAEENRLFSNFAMNNGGLYHMAGVPKGGTFIMVYDKDGEDESVVADFALDSGICCGTSFDHCNDPEAFPPMAKNVYYFLGDNADETEKFQIDVIEFALDVNVELIDLVELPSERSEKDCSVRIVMNDVLGRNVVEYTLMSGFDTGIDRFEYTIENESGLRDTGCVFVAKIPAGANFLMKAFEVLDKGTPSDGSSQAPSEPPANNSGGTDITDGGGDNPPPVLDEVVITVGGGTVRPGRGDDYVVNDRGDYVVSWGHSMENLTITEAHESLIPSRENIAFELINKTKDRYKKVREMGRLNSDASDDERAEYEKLVVTEFKDAMKETAEGIRSLDLQIGDEPTDLKKKLEYRLAMEGKFAARNALLALYDNQSKTLTELVEKESLAKSDTSPVFKFVNTDVRGQLAKIGKKAEGIQKHFTKVASRERMDAKTIELFNSFNRNA